MNYSYQIIDDLFSDYKSIIGIDYDRYRNHVCRIYTYCKLMDSENGNDEKYAIAAVFHDIGIWTDQTFDYLNPSIEQVKKYLIATNKQDWIEEITLMINWHHKMSSYKNSDYQTIEIFRKADWIDVSQGILKFKVKSDDIKLLNQQLPSLGFHAFLIKSTFKNLIKNPLNPLPMFKR